LYESGVVLAIAVEASASKRCGVCTPTSHREFAQAIAADVDAAVDYGNEMSTGDEVKDMPSPGTIDAGEQNVAVERRPKSLAFIDCEVERMDTKVLGGRAQLEMLRARCRAPLKAAGRPNLH